MSTEAIKKEAEVASNKYYIDGEYSCKIKDILADFKNAFNQGAEWRISSVWHNAKLEEPSLWKLILMKDRMGEYDLGYELKENIISWVYVADLIPNND